MITSKKCKFNEILDSKTKIYRNCKKNKYFIDYCYFHYEKIYLKKIIQIQKVYKGYYTRKKLKIYYNLPRDLQRKIIWHINKDIYLKHFHCSIFKLIKKYYINFFKNQNYIDILTDNFIHELILNNSAYLIVSQFSCDILHLMKITLKYKEILIISDIVLHMNLIKNYNLKYIKYLSKESETYKLATNYNLLN